MWMCSGCGEEHEDQFEACWKCGAPKGQQVNGHNTLGVEGKHGDVSSQQPMTCRLCGPGSVIPHAQVLDQGQYSGGGLLVSAAAKPWALLFKGQVMGQVRASICADCGHVELFSDNLEALCAAYQASCAAG
jgi:hypothetical protein